MIADKIILTDFFDRTRKGSDTLIERNFTLKIHFENSLKVYDHN